MSKNCICYIRDNEHCLQTFGLVRTGSELQSILVTKRMHYLQTFEK